MRAEPDCAANRPDLQTPPTRRWRFELPAAPAGAPIKHRLLKRVRTRQAAETSITQEVEALNYFVDPAVWID